MQLGRYQVSTLRPPPIHGIHFSPDGRVFAVATETGYEVWRTWPLGLVRRRSLPGTLARAVPLPHSPLLVLQGGGADPLFPPNKAVIYHDARGVPVAELEFGERIRGIAVRQRTVVIVLLRRVLAYEYDLDTEQGFRISLLGEWATAENEQGLTAVSTAPGSTLLALPGRQPGHVQLAHLPPCPPPPVPPSPQRPERQSSPPPSAPATTFRSPILLAHTHPLSALACSASGAHLLTASERGTLLRVWDTARGALEAELRRGVDRAEIWGLVFEDTIFPPPTGEGRRDSARRKGGRVVGWSDKGTVHVWGGGDKKPAKAPPQSLTNVLSKALSLPNYFSSTASEAQYYLPRKNPHAFSSAIGAAVDAAGLPSMRIAEGDDEPLAERYVVSWIEVDVVDDEDKPSSVDKENRPEGYTGDKIQLRRNTGGMTMGSREERHSFGSDATSTRTATPTRRADTPTAVAAASGVGLHRRSSSGSARTINTARASPQPGVQILRDRDRERSERKRRMTLEAPPVTRRERQLVVITFAGDWYRLALPEPVEQGEDKDKPKTTCKLVEYRRLGVGGGGW